jgi:hypothetical protein
MSILIVYRDFNKKYADYCASQLSAKGYAVSCIDIDIANSEYNLNIYSTPTFFILKNDIPAYPIQGIQNISTILDWANNSNILQE